jgi:hypothetical protein
MTIAADLSNFAFSAAGVNTGGFTMRNKIINGAMVIDQRNVGASGTNTGAATIDRWKVSASQASKYTWQQNAGSVTPPAGYLKYLGITSSSSYSVLATDYFNVFQPIEGYNIVDFAWGTSSAATVTLSFWVRSSLTGTFGGSLTNSASTRCYPFSYSISSANTWEQKTITITGETTGTWLTTNGVGIFVVFSLGYGSNYRGTAGAWTTNDYESVTGETSVVGTSGATWYITGVQLEKGSSATPFEYRNHQQELAMCQRYFCKTFDSGTAPGNNVANAGALRGTARTINASSAIEPAVEWRFPVSMRATPSVTLYSPATSGATNSQWTNDGNGTYSANARASFIGTDGVSIDNTGTILGANQPWVIHATASAEL